jgi:hypothetical protein
VQRDVSLGQLIGDPGTCLAIARLGACEQHFREAGIGPNLVIILAQALAKRTRHVELGRHEHHSRIGAPPQNRLTVAVPRKNAVPVCIEQALDRKLAARGKQAIGLIERAVHGGKRVAAVQPGNHRPILGG